MTAMASLDNLARAFKAGRIYADQTHATMSGADVIAQGLTGPREREAFMNGYMYEINHRRTAFRK